MNNYKYDKNIPKTFSKNINKIEYSKFKFTIWGCQIHFNHELFLGFLRLP